MAEKISTFRERFEELCESSGKTNTELAKDLHVSNQTISAWKTGVRSPKEPAIASIANYFRVSLKWLMGFDVRKDVPTKSMNLLDLLVIPPMPLDPALIEVLQDRDEPQTPKEDAKMAVLWHSASIQAKRAAIAVLESMANEKLK